MEQNNTPMTPFDSIVQTDQLQLLKAAIPHLPSENRKSLSVLVKVLELQNTLQIMEDDSEFLKICAGNEDSSPVAMLNDIRSFCPSGVQEHIDSLINCYEMFAAYETLFN